MHFQSLIIVTMDQHQIFRFTLNLSYDEYAKVYQGIAKNVSVIADDGRRICFPAGRIQTFLTKQGISGYFEMELTTENKFVNIKKITPQAAIH
jgi:uncharacterized protein YwgA